MKFETPQDYGAELLKEIQAPIEMKDTMEFGADVIKDAVSREGAEVPPPRLIREIAASGKEAPPKMQRGAAGHLHYPENDLFPRDLSRSAAQAQREMLNSLEAKDQSPADKLRSKVK